jgi:hypothetical protein
MKALITTGMVPTAEDRSGDWSMISNEQKTEVMCWVEAFVEVAKAGLGIGPSLNMVAERMRVSAATARRQYDSVMNGKVLSSGKVVTGWRALVDYRQHRTEDAETPIAAATVQWWKQIIEQYKGRKNCMAQAHKRCIELWRVTDYPIPGYDTRPPADVHGIPRGWSYSNFQQLVKESKFVRALATTGSKAASQFAFHIPTTRVGLEVGQYMMLDDLWHDFKVKPTLKAPAGRLLELCALDLFSGKKICNGLKCETTDDITGIRKRLQERDMRFLLAALFSLHGYRKGGTTLICEAGTAVVREDIAAALFDCTGGAINVEMGKCKGSPAFPGWYRGRAGGNPRFKAALESSFNLVHNATAMLSGQTGSNERVNAPEELYGRMENDKALLKAIAGIQLRPEKLDMIRWDFMLMSQASSILHDIYAWLDGRHEHDLEGWETAQLVTGQVRVDPRSPHWTPTYALPMLTKEHADAMAALTKIPGCFSLRKMSPTEVWERDASGLVKLPMSVLPQIIGADLSEERKLNDHGAFLFEDSAISHEPMRYQGIAINAQGHQILLNNGESYKTFCNPFDTRFLLVCDARGRYIGRCERVVKVCRADDEGLQRAMGQAAHANAARARTFLARNAGLAYERMETDQYNQKILSGAPVMESELETVEIVRDTRVTAGDREAATEHGDSSAAAVDQEQGEFSAAEISELLKTEK